jgi:hypothetical protein
VSADRYERFMRWYPPQWRSRYGGEMTALLEDSYGPSGGVPMGDRIGLARAGLTERAREAGLVGSARGPAERVRAGSLLVLGGWTLFLVAGAMFGKFTDNWFTGTPPTDRWVASWSYRSVAVAATVGCALVLLAALVAVPGFARLVRAGGWASVRRPVFRAAASAAGAVMAFGAILFWAHHLSWHDRNGGRPLYGALFGLGCLAFLLALACSAAAAISVASRIEWPVGTLRTLGVMAMGVAALMVVIFAGIVAWWVSESLHAPGVLENGIGNGLPYTSRLLPPTLLVSGLLMVVGLVLALFGTARIARAVGRRGRATA